MKENFSYNNKIFRSATFEGKADSNGFPLEKYIKTHEILASNGIKNIITGFVYVSKRGKAIHPGQAGIESDEKITMYKKLTDTVHNYNSKIYLQLAHTGRQTSSKITDEKVLAPTREQSPYFGSKPLQMSNFDINNVIEDFTNATYRAKLAGFDGIQLHAAHGYLIHQFLHPFINKRKDEYGINPITGIGDLFLKKIVEQIRKKCGKDFPILVKISASDSLKEPFSIFNFINLIKVLNNLKVDFIEISFGTMENALNIFRGASIPLDVILKHNFRYKTDNKIFSFFWKYLITPFLRLRIIMFSNMYNLKYSKIAKKLTDIPIITVGGFRNGEDIKNSINKGYTDYVSLSRPFICEPDFLSKLNANDCYISRCVNCNICAIMCDSNNPTKCYHSQKEVEV